MRVSGTLVVSIGGVLVLGTVCLLVGVYITQPKASLQFDHTRYEYGKTGFNTVVKHAFPFRNVGKEEVVLRGVKKSCSCLKAQTTVKRVRPNECGEIQVEYMCPGEVGMFKQSIVVMSNDPEKPYTKLDFSAKVVTDVIVRPASLVFGRVPWGSGGAQEIRVMDGGAEKLEVSDIISKDPLVTVSEVRHRRNKEGRYYSATVHLSPRTPRGSYASSIEVLTNLDDRRQIKIPVSAWVHGNISVSPESVKLGIVSKWNPPVPCTVWIESSGEDFKIEDVAGDVNADASVTAVTDGPRRKYCVTVQLKSSAAAGTINGEILVNTNDPAEKVIRIPYSAIVRNEAESDGVGQ